MQTPLLFWILFNLFIFLMLLLDLGVFHRNSHTVSFKEALIWSVVWIGMALLFNLGILYWEGSQKALEFFTGYVVEKSLSIDNLFVFFVVFKYFQVPSQLQHRVLFWGVVGALALRAIFIFAGSSLLAQFHWMNYIFGAILILTAYKMLFQEERNIEPEKNPIIRLFKRIFPVTQDFHGNKFFIKEAKKWVATPLFLVLLFIESSDIIFAVDSIPAILAISKDTFIVYTSNVFAILGLRSLYFALANFMDRFEYLHYGLAGILGFVGFKIGLSEWIHVPTGLSLGIIATLLTVSVVLSWRLSAKKAK